MKVPLSWLRDLVAVPATADEIARVMSLRGFAVEGIEDAPGGERVIDFEVTANRPDCLSILGMAREVATAFGMPLTEEPAIPQARGGPAVAPLTPGRDAALDVVIDDPDLGPRYVGAVADVRVGPSPTWMQGRLDAAGMRPINNIVDVTNYVLLELGHPMHAFDHATLAGAQIRVRRARPGERVKTLDGQMRELTRDMLVIADAQRPTAIAGVMGGGDSEVTDGTRTIVLESAWFEPRSVRRTSKALALKTEASIRFERGADVTLPPRAMARACALLAAIGAGQARGTMVDCYPAPRQATVLRLRRQQIARVLGIDIADGEVVRILTALGFEPGPAPDGWSVTVPARRVDVIREVDIVEELARHHGFDRVPQTFPALTTPPPPADPRITRARRLRHVMTAAGFSEAVTFGFISDAAAAAFTPRGDIVPIANPLSESFAVLRPTMLAGLVEALAHNRRREQRDVRLFEIGARFTKGSGERRALACAWTGSAVLEHWSAPPRPVDLFDMKAVVQRVLDALRLESSLRPHDAPWLVPGRGAAFQHQNTLVAVLGQLAPAIAEAHGLPAAEPVFVAELDLDAVDDGRSDTDPAVVPLPRYPSIVRDIAILVDDTTASATVRAVIEDAAPPTLVRVREFDRYQGKGIPDGKISLALHLTFRSSDRTLTDAEVQSAMDAVLSALASRLGAAQR